MVLFSFLLYTVLGSASGAAEVKFYIRLKSINVSKLFLQNQDMEADGKKSNLLETLLFVFFCCQTFFVPLSLPWNQCACQCAFWLAFYVWQQKLMC